MSSKTGKFRRNARRKREVQNRVVWDRMRVRAAREDPAAPKTFFRRLSQAFEGGVVRQQIPAKHDDVRALIGSDGDQTSIVPLVAVQI